MFAHGVNRAGYLSIPTRPDLADDFLATAWTGTKAEGPVVADVRDHRPLGNGLSAGIGQQAPTSFHGPYGDAPGSSLRVHHCAVQTLPSCSTLAPPV
jgi:hypothetical protein